MSDFYPFGLSFGEFNRPVVTKNRYGYNGKEQEKEWGVLDYGWRRFDPAIARWNGVDNLAEKYLSFSTYHYAANDPIKNYDLDGNQFTAGSYTHLRRYISNINSRSEKNLTHINEAQAQIDAGVDDKKRKKLQKKIDRLQSENDRFDGIRVEIAALIESDQVYNIVESDKFKKGSGIEQRKVAGALFNQITNEVDIILPNSSGLDFLSHELLHAYQFETGEISLQIHVSLNPIKPLAWLAIDLLDEQQADKRADFFGSKTQTSTATNSIEREVGGVKLKNRTTQSTVQYLFHSSHAGRQATANASRQAFRIGGFTYKPEN